MSSLAYNAILKYVVIGNALPNRLQRYEKNRICARAMRFFLFSGRPLADYGLGFRGVIEPLVGGRA